MVYRKPSPGVSALEAKLETARVSLCRSEMITLKALRAVFDLQRLTAAQLLKNMRRDDPGFVVCLAADGIFTEAISRIDDGLFFGFSGIVSFCELYPDELQAAMEVAEKLDKLRGVQRIEFRTRS